ncbi:phosphotransferase family protein [Nocardioides terrisoli]|uniref:phosphotransferase family protein n=1 Tax=Nocardioides terrisoli TaxID=3388267 RepID=UPI00287BAFE6|nr:phosphotransferase family protein [Nocardioides marmorisolisilvae]
MTAEQTFSLTRSDRLGPALVRATGDERWREHTAALITGGKSNLTFELTSDAGSLILRRPPTGHLLPRAHDMAREARIQRALGVTDVPVPGIVLVGDAPGTLDVPFYVMEKVDGVIPRETLPAGYADSPTDRTALADALIEGLATLHAVDPASVGLGEYGRTQEFAARQVRTWTRQWEATRTHNVPAMTELSTRLGAQRWAEPARATIVHGDYRLDNCVFASDDPRRLVAVLDWELSTLGHPLADLGLLLVYWIQAGETVPVLTPALTREPGFPDRAQLVDRYAELSDADMTELPAYTALAHFKFAAIAQGISARAAGGQMAGQEFGDLDAEVARIAEAGLLALDSTDDPHRPAPTRTDPH